MIKVNMKLTSLIAAVAVSTSLFFCSTDLETVEVSAATYEAINSNLNSYGLTNETKDGTILHAFSWSFNTIKSNMKEIVDAGYSSIQVSPIENCYQNGGRQHTWEWENTYQPTNYNIGNYIVGSRDEFIDLCNEAHKYGVKIIVDVVANHACSDQNQVDSSLKDGKLYHNTGLTIADHEQSWEWNDRWCLTQKNLMGMPDFNTQSYQFQNIIKNYLDDCIDCGADGFRFDTTKHIELPKYVDGNFGGDFWPNITKEIKDKNPSAFVYGEVLQGGGDAYSAYAQYLGVSADSYGGKIRDAINNHSLISKDILDYASEGVSSDSLVTYSETHDTYANNTGASRYLNNWQVKKGYEIVAARAKGTPLFLARPKNNGFVKAGDSWKLDGPVGVPTDDWKDKEVKAVNKFHNAMGKKSEYIRKISEETIGVERGTDGMVIINLNGGFNGDIQTFMKDGIYKDTVSGNNVQVRNGRLHIELGSGQTAVVYNPNEVARDNIAYLKLPSGWGEPYAYVYDESNGEVKQNAAWPGVKMKKLSDRLYSYEVDSSIENPLVIFNDKNNQYPASGQRGLSLTSSMIYEDGNWTEYDK